MEPHLDEVYAVQCAHNRQHQCVRLGVETQIFHANLYVIEDNIFF